MQLVGYFGYGSLVNRLTLATSYVVSCPAALTGWRRHWQSRGTDHESVDGAPLALLSVHRHEQTEIRGMLVLDLAHNLPAVDLREARYDRVAIKPGDLRFLAEMDHALPDMLFVYVGRQGAPASPTLHDDQAGTGSGHEFLLQSYLDTVMSGFETEFGHDGLAHFLETTTGFSRKIVADRHDPVYPRAVKVTGEQAERYDRLLKEAGVRFI
ncbi:MAG: gamma-glutamylcyclotransferase [Rhizobiaceae bacterium]